MTLGHTSADEPARLWLREQCVGYGDRRAKLPDLSFRLLQLLAERAPGPATFDDIAREVWAAHVTRETIKQRVKLLRDSLAALGVAKDAVMSVRSAGYRLTLPTDVQESLAEGGLPGRLPRRIRERPLLSAAMVSAAVAVAAILLANLPWSLKAGAAEAGPFQLSVVAATAQATDVDPRTLRDVSRTLTNDLAHLEGVEVLAGSPKRPQDSELIVDFAVTPGPENRSLSLRLVNARSGLILWAETYPFDPDDHHRAVAHFTSYVHANVDALSLTLGRNGHGRQPSAAREEYLSVLALTRGAGEPDLLVARRRLDALLARRPSFALARALRAQVNAELVLRHDHDRRLAATALNEARALVASYPFGAEFKYTLARAEMAAGDNPAALRTLHAAAHGLPFLDRDIQALERQLAEAPGELSKQ